MRSLCCLGLLALAACAVAPPPLDLLPPAEQVDFPYSVVWASEAELALREQGGDATTPVPYLFMRLDVLGFDSLGVRVRCVECPGMPEGYLSEQDVVRTPLLPNEAANGTLAEFSLAVREAALSHDLEALWPVMAPDFSFSFMGIQNPDAAFAVWQAEQFASLAEVPRLLDQGLASRDGQIWSAPPAFAERLDYRGLRLGFRERPDGRWEWLYLIRGIVP